MSPPTWLANLGFQKPDINEFLSDPTLRLYCSFFLGWLTLLSLYYLSKSSILYSLARKLRLIRSNNDSTTIHIEDAEKSSLSHSNPKGDPYALVFLLDIFVLTTAINQFASLMVYVEAEKTSCVFLVAWGGLGAQTVRLLGIIKLSLHLKELRARRWECWLIWLLLLVSAVLMFLTNAVTKGIVSPFMTPEQKTLLLGLLSRQEQIPDITKIINAIDKSTQLSFCYRKHFTFTAALTSALNLLLEVYLLARILILRMAVIWPARQRYLAFADIRVLRALSLFALDAALLWPALNFINVASEYLPFIVGAMFVLVAFNHRPTYGYSLVGRQSTTNTEVSTPTTGPMLPTITPPSTFRVETPMLSSVAPSFPNSRQPPFTPNRDAESIAPGSSYGASIGHGSENFMPSIIRENKLSPIFTQPSPVTEQNRVNVLRKPVPESLKPKSNTRGALQPIVTDQESLANMPKQHINCPLVAALNPMSSVGSDTSTPSVARPPPPRFPRLVQQHTRAVSHTADSDSLRALGFDTTVFQPPSTKASVQESQPVTPNSAIRYGSDILGPDDEVKNVMKGSSRSGSEKHLSNGTSNRHSSSSSFFGGPPSLAGKYSRRSSLANNYPFSIQGVATGSSSDDRVNASDGYDVGEAPAVLKGEKRITFGEIIPRDFASSSRKPNTNNSGSQTSHSNPTTSEEDLGRRLRKDKGKAARS